MTTLPLKETNSVFLSYPRFAICTEVCFTYEQVVLTIEDIKTRSHTSWDKGSCSQFRSKIYAMP